VQKDICVSPKKLGDIAGGGRHVARKSATISIDASLLGARPVLQGGCAQGLEATRAKIIVLSTISFLLIAAGLSMFPRYQRVQSDTESCRLYYKSVLSPCCLLLIFS
jgi:hypothetical protein